MNRLVSGVLSIVSVAAMTACNPVPDQNAKTPPTQDSASASGVACQSRANSRLALFDRPSTYPISAEEKRNAYLALYNECMREYEPKIATAKPNFTYAPGGSAAELAAMSPAAGGAANPAAPKGGIIAYANGTTVIDTAQLANLSPAAGGKVAGVPGVTTSTANGATVVVVQSGAVAPMLPPAAPPPPTRPAAVPVASGPVPTAPTAQTAPTQPAPAAVKNAEETEAQAQRKTATKAHKPAKTYPQNTAKDTRTRFEKNAVPVTMPAPASAAGMNTLQPSAGTMVDSAVNANRLPAKE